MMQTGSVSRSVAASRPVYGYLNRPVLASTRLCNISLPIGCNRGLQRFHRAAQRAAEEPVAGLAADTPVSERGTGLVGGCDGGRCACGASVRICRIKGWALDAIQGSQRFHRAVRRAAEQPVAGLAAELSGSERGTGGDDGG
jgi:hypothetical protein